MLNKNKRKRLRNVRIDTLVGRRSTLVGDLAFCGGLHVDGNIRGNVAAEDETSVLTLSEHGSIEGDVRAPQIILDGTVVGDVYCSGRIELAPKARITGDVHYHLIEMAMGAEVNGSLVHQDEQTAEVNRDEARAAAPKVSLAAAASADNS